MPRTPQPPLFPSGIPVLCFATALAVALVDQLSKAVVLRYFSETGPSRVLIPDIFHLTLVRNDSSAFNLLSFIPLPWRLPVIVIFTLGALVFLVHFALTAPRTLRFQLPLGLVLGGALGNLIDRLLRSGAVVDFLQVGWKEWTWPVFNAADSCISTGILILLVVLWREPQERKV